MSTPQEKAVSLRKFATMTGTSDGGVRKAILKGSISDGVVDGKIMPSLASVEWGKAILDGWVVAESGEWEFYNPGEAISLVKPAAPVIQHQVINYEPEVIPEPEPELYDGTIPEIVEADVYTGDEDVINDPADAAEFLKDIPQGTSKIEAERLYSVFRARKVKRELQKLEGELVDKGLVYKNLYEFAAIIRDKFMNVPDRVIDNIMAADSRNEAIAILANEITEVLQSLATVGQIKLTVE